jgi:ABC-type polar amino acid transport system ATPase subunit
VRGLRKRFGKPTRCCVASTSTCSPATASPSWAPSGSGKSTLLRCLNFMERPSAGTVALAGQAIGRARGSERRYDEAELTRVRQRVGMVFQQFNLFPHMTVLAT